MMTQERAKQAASTLEDVFTRDGTAVVIERVSTRSTQKNPHRSTVGAVVSGQEYHEDWLPLADLTAKEDL